MINYLAFGSSKPSEPTYGRLDMADDLEDDSGSGGESKSLIEKADPSKLIDSTKTKL